MESSGGDAEGRLNSKNNIEKWGGRLMVVGGWDKVVIGALNDESIDQASKRRHLQSKYPSHHVCNQHPR